eukprot:6201478-Pleurochrysis_carterae.AAC.1
MVMLGSVLIFDRDPLLGRGSPIVGLTHTVIHAPLKGDWVKCRGLRPPPPHTPTLSRPHVRILGVAE